MQTTQKISVSIQNDSMFLTALERDLHETIETVNGRDQIIIHHINHIAEQHLNLSKFTLDCCLIKDDALEILPKNTFSPRFTLKVHPTIQPHLKKLPSYLTATQCQELLPCIESEIALRIFDELTESERRLLSSPPFPDRTGYQQQLFASCFNKLVADIRTLYNSRTYKKKRQRRDKKFKRMFDRCKLLIKQLLEVYARIVVVRIDFGVKQDLSQPNASFNRYKADMHTLPFMKKKIKHLLDNSRHSTVLKNKIGYVLRFEHGDSKGVHVHGFFFFDGSKHQQDISLAQQISAEWMRITEGLGTVHICNMNEYKYPATGSINYYDDEKIGYLFNALEYICKTEQFLKYTVLHKNRAFQLSHPPKPKSQAGRPRQSPQSTKLHAVGA